jgi:endonuclease G
VAVPNANFKIVVILRRGEGAADVAEVTPVIAVLMPNEPGVGPHAWTDYVTSVDRVEEETGYDFLSAVPEPVQRVIEARKTADW